MLLLLLLLLRVSSSSTCSGDDDGHKHFKGLSTEYSIVVIVGLSLICCYYYGGGGLVIRLRRIDHLLDSQTFDSCYLLRKVRVMSLVVVALVARCDSF
jgi:hypothetical protein